MSTQQICILCTLSALCTRTYQNIPSIEIKKDTEKVSFCFGLPVGARTQICRLGGDGVIPLRYGKKTN